jgi:hypothetical protein
MANPSMEGKKYIPDLSRMYVSIMCFYGENHIKSSLVRKELGKSDFFIFPALWYWGSISTLILLSVK